MISIGQNLVEGANTIAFVGGVSQAAGTAAAQFAGFGPRAAILIGFATGAAGVALSGFYQAMAPRMNMVEDFGQEEDMPDIAAAEIEELEQAEQVLEEAIQSSKKICKLRRESVERLAPATAALDRSLNAKTLARQALVAASNPTERTPEVFGVLLEKAKAYREVAKAHYTQCQSYEAEFQTYAVLAKKSVVALQAAEKAKRVAWEKFQAVREARGDMEMSPEEVAFWAAEISRSSDSLASDAVESSILELSVMKASLHVIAACLAVVEADDAVAQAEAYQKRNSVSV